MTSADQFLQVYSVLIPVPFQWLISLNKFLVNDIYKSNDGLKFL